MPSFAIFLSELTDPTVQRDAGSCVFWDGRCDPLISLHRKFTLHEIQAKMCHQIRTDFHLWHGLPRPRRTCTLGTLQHGTPPKTCAQLTSATPRDGELLFQCDFKDHDTLPRWTCRSWLVVVRWESPRRHDLDILGSGARSCHERTSQYCSKTMELVFPVRDCLHYRPLRDDARHFYSTARVP